MSVALLMLVVCLGSGCDGDSSSSGSAGENNAFVGTWLIQKESTKSYWVFNEEGTFSKKRAGQPANGSVHFNGIFTVAGGKLKGDFANHGVGTGEIEATIDNNGTMQLLFIEHWHTPYKKVPCTGVRQ